MICSKHSWTFPNVFSKLFLLLLQISRKYRWTNMLGGGREGGRERQKETERGWFPRMRHETGRVASYPLGHPYGPFQGSVQWDPVWAPQSHSFYIPYTSRCCMPPFTCFLVLLWLSILLRSIPACGWEFRFQTGCWRCPNSVPEPPQDSNYMYSVFF